jgi:hypothetical protein
MAKARKSKKLAPPALRVISGGRTDAADPDKSTGPVRKRRDTQGKRVQFDIETWQALDLMGRDRMMTFQELADEAFRDLLKKHGRPMNLKDALKRSAAQADKPEEKAAGRPARAGKRRSPKPKE